MFRTLIIDAHSEAQQPTDALSPCASFPSALPFWAQFSAGAIAGVTELLCLYPLGEFYASG